MSKLFYPAVFKEEDDGYSISFPDLPGCFSEGDTLEEAYEMAFDAIGLYLEARDNIFHYPKASYIKDINLKTDEFVALIEFDAVAYKKKHDNHAVKKTLTLPSWLNALAEENNINFSQLLQNALKEQLGVK